MKSTKLNRPIFLVIVIIASLIPIMNTSAVEKPIELTFNMQFPARSWAATEEWGPFARNIESLCQGRLKIRIFWGSTLSSPMDAYDSAIKGIADIAYSVHAYTPGRFPVMSLFELPGLGRTMMANQHVLFDLYSQFPQIAKEHEGAQVIWLGAIREMSFLTATKKIYKFEDLKGLRIRAAGGSTAATIGLWDAAPIMMPITDIYASLQRKVVDGTTADWNVLEAFKFPEVTKYATVAPIPGNSMFVIMNAEKFRSLPEDIQTIFIKEGERHWIEVGARADQEAFRAMQRFQKLPGREVIILPQEERQRWLESAKPVYDKWVADVDSRGLPAKEILDKALQLAEKYNAMFPPPWAPK